MRLPLRRKDTVPSEATPTFAASARPGPRRLPTAPGPRQANVPLSRRRLVTVSIEDGSARIVVLKGKQVLTWWTADLAAAPRPPEESGNGHGPMQPSRPPLTAYAAPTGRIVADLPLKIPLIRHFTLTKVGKHYLEQVVLSEILDSIPFPREDVDIFWQAKRVGDEREVFAVAVAKQAMDSHVQQLRAAGLRPRAAYAKAVALASVAGVPDAVVVSLGLAQASIVLVRNSVPLAIHQMELREQEADQAALAAALAQDIELVASYNQPLEPQEGDAQVPVVLTGLLASRAPLVAALPAALDREMLPLATPFLIPQGFDPNEYAINLGLALADSARAGGQGKATRSGVPSLNLLPPRYLPKPLPTRQIAVFLTLALFAAATLGLRAQVSHMSSEAAALAGRLDSMERGDREQRISLLRASSLEAKAKTAANTISTLTAHLEGARNGTESTMDRLDTLVSQAALPRVQLSAIGLQGNNFALSGSAATYEDVLRYADDLRSSGAFVEVRTTRMDALAASGEGAGIGAGGTASAGAGATTGPDGGSGAGTAMRLPQPTRPKVSFQIKASVAPPAQETSSKPTSK